MKLNLGKYSRLIAAAVGTGINLAVYQWGATNHWVNFAIAAATLLGVYGVSETTKPGPSVEAFKAFLESTTANKEAQAPAAPIVVPATPNPPAAAP